MPTGRHVDNDYSKLGIPHMKVINVMHSTYDVLNFMHNTYDVLNVMHSTHDVAMHNIEYIHMCYAEH
jgi:hypothetical protein